jgi:CRP-like cAMP-binding protein
LLDADADLAAGVPPVELVQARRRALVRVLALKGPVWDAGEMTVAAQPEWQGLFILDGLLLRRVRAAGRSAGELLGAGDVFRPWDDDGSFSSLPIEVDFAVLEPVRVAVLDGHFSQRIAPWPTIHAQLIGRLADRARYLSLMHAVTSLTRTHARLLLALWLVSERWGRVSTSGVSVTLPLTHQVLALLVGCHRPAVTIAVKHLEREGLLARPAKRTWLLTPAALEYLREPERLSELSTRLGDFDAEPPIRGRLGRRQLDPRRATASSASIS